MYLRPLDPDVQRPVLVWPKGHVPLGGARDRRGRGGLCAAWRGTATRTCRHGDCTAATASVGVVVGEAGGGLGSDEGGGGEQGQEQEQQEEEGEAAWDTTSVHYCWGRHRCGGRASCFLFD